MRLNEILETAEPHEYFTRLAWPENKGLCLNEKLEVVTHIEKNFKVRSTKLKKDDIAANDWMTAIAKRKFNQHGYI